MRTAAVALLAAIIGALGACTSDGGDDVAPTDPCRATIDEAGAAAEIADQIDLLDQALVVCATPEVFSANVERYPTLLGWDVSTYLSNRCRSADVDAVRRSRICTSENVAPTTNPSTDVPDVVYVGTTLDGREVEIRPRPGRPFEDGRPEIVDDMADIAERLGCDGVESEYERWVEQIDDPQVGDEASVYAQHALDVLAFVQCDLPADVAGE
ncbi:MAG: hypothetical protein WD225_10210 [Ilumatobacteraceae bacterium]